MTPRQTLCPSTGKRIHWARGKAVKALIALASNPHQHGVDPHIYRCPICAGWHVGHIQSARFLGLRA